MLSDLKVGLSSAFCGSRLLRNGEPEVSGPDGKENSVKLTLAEAPLQISWSTPSIPFHAIGLFF